MIIIALEGIDACGKTSVATSLDNSYISGLRVRRGGEFMSPIGGILIAELPRLTPMEKVYWFAADRAWTLEWLRRQRADLVVWDRYLESAFAYRTSEMRMGLAPVGIEEVVTSVNRAFPAADLNVYLSLEPELAMARRRMEFDTRWQGVAEYYSRRSCDPDYAIIDASMEFNEVVTAVEAKIWQLVESRKGSA